MEIKDLSEEQIKRWSRVVKYLEQLEIPNIIIIMVMYLCEIEMQKAIAFALEQNESSSQHFRAAKSVNDLIDVIVKSPAPEKIIERLSKTTERWQESLNAIKSLGHEDAIVGFVACMCEVTYQQTLGESIDNKYSTDLTPDKCKEKVSELCDSLTMIINKVQA